MRFIVTVVAGCISFALVCLVAQRVVGSPARSGRRPTEAGARPFERPGSPLTVWLVVALAVVAAPITGGASLVIPLAGTVAVVRSRYRTRALARRQARLVVGTLPEFVDLLLLATTSGLVVHQAIRETVPHAAGPLGHAFSEALARAATGQALADEIEAALAALGEPVRPLSSVLTAGLRYGTPMTEPLERLVHDARLQRRRSVEEQARRLPILLLLPLVVCGLPSFILLAVVPIALTALDQLNP